MKILICFDSFKDSVSSEEISNHITTYFLKKFPDLDISPMIVADGGEGTLDALRKSKSQYNLIECPTIDALQRPILASYLLDKQERRVTVEMAQSCGLQLLSHSERDCKQTTSYGMGLQIKDALKYQPKYIDLFIGGSATNDLGLGMISALGAIIRDGQDQISFPCGRDLKRISDIDLGQIDYLDQINFNIICDVENKLLGINGAAHTYAKQKGASDEDLVELEKGAQNITAIVSKKYQTQNENKQGAGAAGGMGYGAMTFLNANYQSGVNYLLETLGIDRAIEESDLIITGEGRIDKQTLHGKLIKGVADAAAKNGKKVIAISAINTLSPGERIHLRIEKFYDLYHQAPPSISKEDTKKRLDNVLQEIVLDYINLSE